MVTVGAVWSTVLAVVNEPPFWQTLLPASSSKPQTVISSCVLAGYGVRGVKVTDCAADAVTSRHYFIVDVR